MLVPLGIKRVEPSSIKKKGRTNETSQLQPNALESSRMNTAIYVIPVVLQEYGSYWEKR